MQNQALADAAFRVAKEFLGQKEKTGHNDGPFVQFIQEWFGGTGEDGAPWCAIFRSFCDAVAAAAIGIKPVLPKTDSSSELYAFARAHGFLLPHPIPNCIGLLRETNPSTGKTHKHTFRLYAIDPDGINVDSVDGNESNQVEYAKHPIVQCDWVMCC